MYNHSKLHNQRKKVTKNKDQKVNILIKKFKHKIVKKFDKIFDYNLLINYNI